MKILNISLGLVLLSIAGCASNPSSSTTKYVNTAIQEARKYVADGKTEFFMFHIPANSPIESTTVTLKRHLSEAAISHANLAIIGADHDLNFSILKIALAESDDESLAGMNLIYVGDIKHFEELRNLALRAGAIFNATTYPVK